MLVCVCSVNRVLQILISAQDAHYISVSCLPPMKQEITEAEGFGCETFNALCQAIVQSWRCNDEVHSSIQLEPSLVKLNVSPINCNKNTLDYVEFERWKK